MWFEIIRDSEASLYDHSDTILYHCIQNSFVLVTFSVDNVCPRKVSPQCGMQQLLIQS